MMAFDADVLIYAASPLHPLGQRVMKLFDSTDQPGVGSVLLLPEVLPKPLRADAASQEAHMLFQLLAHLDLRPVDQATAQLAVSLATKYRLKAADATHLATAVAAGAEQFVTNNRKDFPRTITEIDVVYPDELPLPT